MADDWSRYTHPETVAALESGQDFVHAVDDMMERVDDIRARRPSPSSRVIPEVDGYGRLTDLYIAPGTIAHSAGQVELAADILAAIQESTVDAARQHRLALQETTWPRLREPQA
ncbi:hypothetical protein [Nocardia sp. NPDC024068]|uniref:hypothetical protein n=1 Tax=Nocardia sp. NPDC024068 TaxID=3157197 RepID=UPI0033FB20A2